MDRGRVLMGIQGVVGWLFFIVPGATGAARALRVLVRARRSETDSAAFPAGAWSRLSVSLVLIVSGVLYLRYPHSAWLNWILGTAVAAAVTEVIISSIEISRSRRLRPGSTSTPGLGSADMPGPDPAIAPDASTAGLIERIKNARFSTTRLTPGYDQLEVDAFLDKLVAVLSEDGQVDRSELRDIRFSTTMRLRPAYAMPDVDTFLEEVAQATW